MANVTHAIVINFPIFAASFLVSSSLKIKNLTTKERAHEKTLVNTIVIIPTTVPITPLTTIPKSVVSMSYGTFLGCDKLERVIFKDKNNLPEGLKSAFMGFDFDSYEVNGDEVTFIRNIENNKSEENE